MKFFNTEGPVKPDKHYFLLHRLDKNELYNLIDRERYFILHAPRQTEKTTEILQFVRELNTQGIYKALYINVEEAQAARDNTKEGIFTILRQLYTEIKQLFPHDHAIQFLQQILQEKQVQKGFLSMMSHTVSI